MYSIHKIFHLNGIILAYIVKYTDRGNKYLNNIIFKLITHLYSTRATINQLKPMWCHLYEQTAVVIIHVAMYFVEFQVLVPLSDLKISFAATYFLMM